MLQVSNILKGDDVKLSPIRRIMEMADKKNLINLGLNPDDVISFAGGWVNHEAPEELRRQYKDLSKDKASFHKLGAYSPTEGTIELKKMLVDMDRELYGKEGITEKNLIIGQSSTQLTFDLFVTILNPHDRVLLFDPTYANYPEQINICQRGKKIVTLNVFDKDSWSYMNNKNLLLTKLEETIKDEKPKLILFSSPDNPTGQILGDSFVDEMLRIALKYDVFVAIDGAYQTQYYTKKTPKHFSFNPKEYENLIRINSHSKWCRGLGRRIGWLEANEKVIQAIKIVQQSTILCPDTIHQAAMTNYIKGGLEDGSLKKYIDENRKKYKRTSEFMSKCIERYLRMQYLKPKGGLYTVVNVGIDGDKFVYEILKGTGVIFVPGSGFGKSLSNGIRISFGPLVNDLKKMKTGFLRVKEFLNFIGLEGVGYER